MKKHYATHVEDTDKLISVAGPILEYETWYEQYKKLMEEQAQRKYGLYTPTSEGGDDFDPSSFVGEWKLVSDEMESAGIVKPSSLFVFNKDNGLIIYINNTSKGQVLNTKTLKAICSDGRVYSDDWSEMLVSEEQPIASSNKYLMIGSNGNHFTKIALKNLAIYNHILSKDDCIKAYDYLQTLKAK